MREMKDSGIDWIGYIPEEWKILRVKNGFNQKKSKAHQEDPVVLSLARSGVKIRDMSNAEGQFAASYYDYNPVAVDDMLINPMDLISGDNCSLSKVEGVISPAYVNLRYKEGFLPSYYQYYFKYQYWCMAFFAHGKGVSFDNRWTLNNETLMKYPLLVPPFQIQQKIATFLDDKCSEIDSLRSDIEKEIELLEEYKKSVITEAVTKGLNPDAEMKDSGIEWIGDIPKDWEVDRIKYHFKRNEPRNPGNTAVLSVYREYGVIPKDSRNDNHNVTSEDTSKYKYVRKGDLVINKMKAWQGSLAVSDYEGIVSPAYFIYNFTDNLLNKKYFHFLIRSCYKDEFRRISGGIREGQWDLPAEGFANEYILIPPIDEQNMIVEYIESQITEIVGIIADKKSQLETLNEYKKSLIYEYVTGKKEVPSV